MKQEPKAGRVIASFEQIAYSNMLVVQAIVELLIEKGALTNQELLDRIQRLKQQTRVNPAAAENAAGVVPEPPGARVALVSLEDLVSANMIAVEALLALLVDKAFLTEAEMEELLGELRSKASKTFLRKQ